MDELNVLGSYVSFGVMGIERDPISDENVWDEGWV